MKIDSSQSLIRSLTETQKKRSESLQKLSSGKAFQPPMAAAEISRESQLNQASSSAQASEKALALQSSQLKIKDAGLSSSGSDLQRLRELALQSSNGSLNDVDRLYLQAEYSQQLEQLKRGAGNSFPEVANLKSSAISSQTTAENSLEVIDSAIDRIQRERSQLGAEMSRLESQQNVESSKAVSTAQAQANSEVDYASEVSELKRLEMVHKAQLKALKSQLNIEKEALSSLFKTKI